ncbi:hypothetical protein [Telmatospirillum sp.]|uniref:hypothetical protein n=1 Tax=Telmatospirillum sp. TaxID=2079197 RepID=UPI002844F3E4|nr:hypothetical protein [Telmatospirillum sp.]MDR3438739.1 hypothetical protein [Telmatospirillum sp.]
MRVPLLVQAVIFALMVFGNGAEAGAFNAGVGRADIQIPADLYPIDGFVGQHDPLAVRVLLMEDGSERIGIVVMDLTSISDEVIANAKAILNKAAGVSSDNIIVCASHTFSAPHVLPLDHSAANLKEKDAALGLAIGAAVQAATTQATSTLQPARLGFGLGNSRVNVNRDVPTARGWWFGANETGYADSSLAVLRLNTLDGKPLAVLMNHAVQSSIMSDSESEKGGKLVSADLAGAATRYLETHYGSGMVAMFLVGAAGDQAPYLMADRYVANKDGSVSRNDIHDAGFTLVDLLGERLGGDVLRVSEEISSTNTPKLRILRSSVEVISQAASPESASSGPVTSYTYQPGAKVGVPVVLIQIGDIVLVGFQAELAASVGTQIKIGSPFAHTIVLTMVDGIAKYMPDAASYGRFTYEARNSRYARGSGEAAASAVVSLLKQMHDTPARP